MPYSNNDQKTPTTNQVKNIKPSITKNANILGGTIANSINGGHVKPIHYKYVMAGEGHFQTRIRMNLKMITPKAPNFCALKGTLRAFFVPHSRVWKNAEKFLSQKGGDTEIKIKEIPNIGGYGVATITDENGQNLTRLTDTTLWRDSYISTYIPRYQTGPTEDGTPYFPKISVLPLRGFRAIYNDYLRNKAYDEEVQEYNEDTVSPEEYNSYLPISTLNDPNKQTNLKTVIIRAKKQNSYYTDYRTELLGEITDEPNNTQAPLLNLTEWEKLVAEYRSQAENEQANDWEIISKIRGSKLLTEGKTQYLGQKTFNMNFVPVTQSTYNINENIGEEYQSLGEQGAYVYTEIDIPLTVMQKFDEEGYIHITFETHADTVYETGIERTSLNVGALDIYRPDLKDVKQDVLYNIEKNTINVEQNDLYKVTGYKRKFNEYFKAPNVISGDLTTEPWQTVGMNFKLTGQPVLTQKAYQFFEQSDKEHIIDLQDGTRYYLQKDIWKDYTDLLINENQVVKGEIEGKNYADGQAPFVIIRGQNQIFFVGRIEYMAELPINNEDIKHNVTEWGEM